MYYGAHCGCEYIVFDSGMDKRWLCTGGLSNIGSAPKGFTITNHQQLHLINVSVCVCVCVCVFLCVCDCVCACMHEVESEVQMTYMPAEKQHAHTCTNTKPHTNTHVQTAISSPFGTHSVIIGHASLALTCFNRGRPDLICHSLQSTMSQGLGHTHTHTARPPPAQM